MRVCVLTASIGESRPLVTPAIVRPEVDYLCVTDREIEHPVWRIVRMERDPEQDPCRQAKRVKLRPELFVPDGTDAVIWVDRHCRLMCDPVAICERDLASADVAVVMHHARDIYHEARTCRERRKDDADLITETVERFRAEGWPIHSLVYFGGFLIRRINPVAKHFGQLWEHYVDTGSRRDQLSLPVALKRSACRAKLILTRRRGQYFEILAK